MNLLTQQTKELVRRKTEILVHGSEIEQEKEEDHHKNWTLRRMQTRGTCSLIARIPTVKLKIPGKAFLKSESRTSVTFKL